MPLEEPTQRMTLRELMVHAEKSCRHLIEDLHAEMATQLADFRDLTRPTRRRSHYPTLLSLQNSLKSLMTANDEVQSLTNDLHHQLQIIHQRAQRESVNKL